MGRGGSHVHASSAKHTHHFFPCHTFFFLCLFHSPFLILLFPSFCLAFIRCTFFIHFLLSLSFYDPFSISWLLHSIYIPTSHYILSRSHTQTRAGPLHQSVTEDINCHRGNNRRQQAAGSSGILCSVCLAI